MCLVRIPIKRGEDGTCAETIGQHAHGNAREGAEEHGDGDKERG